MLKAYGAGVRAGRVHNKRLVQFNDGTSRIATPTCPYKRKLQFISRFLWWEGYYDGLRYLLEATYAGRR